MKNSTIVKSGRIKSTEWREVVEKNLKRNKSKRLKYNMRILYSVVVVQLKGQFMPRAS